MTGLPTAKIVKYLFKPGKDMTEGEQRPDENKRHSQEQQQQQPNPPQNQQSDNEGATADNAEETDNKQSTSWS